MTGEEMARAERSAGRNHMNRSEFSRHAINAASAQKKNDSSYPLGVLKNRVTYKKAMQLIRG